MTKEQLREHFKGLTFQLHEEIVDAAMRMGVNIDVRDQSVFMLLLEGRTLREIEELTGADRQEAKERAESAYYQLQQFLRQLTSLEEQKENFEARQQRQRRINQKHIDSLKDEISRLRKEQPTLKGFVMQTPIHRLPFSCVLQSVLLKAGLYSYSDIAALSPEDLKAIPGMTPPLLEALKRFSEIVNKFE